MKTLSLLITMLFASHAFSAMDEQNLACRILPTMVQQTRSANLKAANYKEYVESLTGIARDAKILNDVSASVAVASGTLGIVAGSLAILPVNLALADFIGLQRGISGFDQGLVGIVQKKNFGGILASVIGGMTGYAVMGTESAAVATGVMTAVIGVTLSSPIDMYVIGKGVYQLHTSTEIVSIEGKELKLNELKARSLIEKNRIQIGTLLDHPPTTLDNGFGLGRPMKLRMEQIATLAEEMFQASLEIAKSKSIEMQLVKKACDQ